MARPDITMSDAEVIRFLEKSRVIQLATIGRDGWPHLTPMWFFVDDGHVVFRSFTKSQKIVNLQRNPRLAVLAETGNAYSELRGVMIRGTARLVTDREYVLHAYGRLAARYPMLGDQPLELPPEALEEHFGRFAAKNTAVVVEPERITSWDHRKLGGGY
jgi:PPOX class probable F420-dependent enzyme